MEIADLFDEIARLNGKVSDIENFLSQVLSVLEDIRNNTNNLPKIPDTPKMQ